MLIIGLDFHPSVQQIAFLDLEAGEAGERQLNHSEGEVERFYRELKQQESSVRVGMEATGNTSWFESINVQIVPNHNLAVVGLTDLLHYERRAGFVWRGLKRLSVSRLGGAKHPAYTIHSGLRFLNIATRERKISKPMG